MKRLGLIVVTALLMLVFAPSTAFAATTINPAAAPTGTHLQTGSIGCSVDSATLLVTCSTFELAGVGNSNATGSLNATYNATVEKFGERGVMDLIGLTGYYTMLAMVLNVTRVPLPEGTAPPLPILK